MLKAVTSVATGERGFTQWSARLRSALDVRYVTLVTAVATYALIVLGGTVRATDSGLACPDWPLCHGEVIPPLDYHVLIEYSHRLAAAAVGILVFATAVTAWLWHRDSPILRAGAVLVLALLIVQVLVGGVTVNMELPDTIVALHLSIALILLAILITMSAAAFAGRGYSTEKASDTGANAKSEVLSLTMIAAVGVFALIITGSYVANAGAALVYPDWPLFDGKLVSAGGQLADLHYAHRVMAAVVGLLLLAVVVRAWRSERRPLLLATLGVALVLYVAQVFVGASNIWFTLATEVRVAHLALASAVWAALVLGAAWVYVERRPA